MKSNALKLDRGDDHYEVAKNYLLSGTGAPPRIYPLIKRPLYLERADGHMVRPEVMDEFFKVAYRDARYFHRFKGTFYLHLLAVLRPAGK